MAKCVICSVNCTSCNGGQCDCWMKSKHIRVSNKIILEKPWILSHPIYQPKLIELVMSWLPQKIVSESIELSPEEIEERRVEYTSSLNTLDKKKHQSIWVCVYPIGSSKLWERAECIYCNKAKFYNLEKTCEALNK